MSSLHLQSILDSALDALVTIDSSGSIVEFNAVAERMFNYQRTDVIGQQMVDLIVPPELRADHAAGMKKYQQTGEGPVLNQRIRITAQRSNGDVFPIELAIVPFQNEGDEMFTATIRDMTETVEREHRLEASMKREILLRRELDHRVKNNLGQILVMCRQAMSRSTVDLQNFEDLSNRVIAMATIHDLFGSMSPKGIALSELVLKGCAPYLLSPEQLDVAGPTLYMPAKTAMTFSVVINELATNAAKHGALREEDGRIQVDWEVDGDILFTWSEHTSDPIETEVKPSFGFQLLDSMIPYELGGSIEYAFEPAGFRFKATVPGIAFESTS